MAESTSTRLLRVLLEVVPKSTNAFQKALGADGASGGLSRLATQGPGGSTDRDRSKNLQALTNDWSNMHKEIAKLNLAMRPDLVAKQVDLEIKLSKAREAHAKAIDKEQRERRFGTGFMGQLLSRAPGGQGGANLAEMFGLSTKLGAGLGAIGGAAGIGVGVAGGVLAGGMAAVGTRSPATAERFERAMMDITAVIGDTFAPIMDLATDGLRLFGDVLASILPTAGEMREVLQPLFGSLQEMREAITPIAPLIKDEVVSVLKGLAAAVAIAADQISIFAEGIKYASYLLPWTPSSGKPLASATGMAATSASFVGGEERGRSAYAAAFAAGATRGTAEMTENNTAKTAENTLRMVELLGRVIGDGGATQAVTSGLKAAVRGWF